MKRIYQQVISRLHLANTLWRFQKRGLYCMNFHRIGDWTKAEFDPCVFSCTGDDFRSYLGFFRENFSPVTLSDVEDLIAADQPITERLLLITFDDGYNDNYTTALPILREFGLQATFFVTTGLIESGKVSWWDEIAWHVKSNKGSSLQLKGWQQSILIDGNDEREDIRNVLRQVKSTREPIDAQLREIRESFGDVPPNAGGQNEFMTWQQLQGLVDAGMAIGAHSHSHAQFSTLRRDELKYELTKCKSELESRLGVNVTSLSYPVGARTSFDSSMFSMVEDCGYDLAFSFEPVVNLNLRSRRYELGRISVDIPYHESNLVERCIVAPKI